MSVFEHSEVYSPKYHALVEYAVAHEKVHWIEQDVNLQDDVEQYKRGAVTEDEKQLLKSILRLFTEADKAVGQGYLEVLIPLFKNNEARAMLTSFAAREFIHQRGYALLNDTLGYGEDFYYEFLDWAEMKEKAEFMLFQESTGDKYRDGLLFLAKQTLVEGISLFASFVMLLNFDRKGKMPGMVDVVKWSINDEGENHVTGNSYLFKLALEEKPYLVTDDFKLSIYNTVRELVRLEDAFIDVCFESRTVADLNPEDVKQYIRYIADIRLIQLGLKPNWDVSTNPLPWVDTLIGKTEASFFERQVVEYSKANLSGEWVY